MDQAGLFVALLQDEEPRCSGQKRVCRSAGKPGRTREVNSHEQVHLVKPRLKEDALCIRRFHLNLKMRCPLKFGGKITESAPFWPFCPEENHERTREEDVLK